MCSSSLNEPAKRLTEVLKITGKLALTFAMAFVRSSCVCLMSHSLILSHLVFTSGTSQTHSRVATLLITSIIIIIIIINENLSDVIG